MPLTDTQARVLRTVRRSNEPLSGRRVASATALTPNTVNRALRALETLDAVTQSAFGKANLWSATPFAADLLGEESAAPGRVALVVTAVGLEHEAVRKRLINTERERINGLRLLRGELSGEDTNWTIHLAQAGMGNTPTAALTGLAAGPLNANVVVFVGSAGGLRSDEYLHGDVVVANLIHNAHAGKQVSGEPGPSKLLSRGKTFHVPAPLLSLVNSLINDTEWTPTRSSEHFKHRGPHAYVAPIVATEAVQADVRGPLIEQIREHFQDSVALDMESYGLAAGSDLHDLPVLVIRGISDFLGGKTTAADKKWQPEAVDNAARFLVDLLNHAHPDDFRRGPQTPTPDPAPSSGDASLPELPDFAQVWETRLRRRSEKRADDALESLARTTHSGGTAATWLNRSLHRPPMWLRDDDTGDGWAFAAALAQVSGSTVTHRAFAEAARVALETGDEQSAAYFKIAETLRLSRPSVRESAATGTVAQISDQTEPDGPTGAPNPASVADDEAHVHEALSNLPTYVKDHLGPVIDFYRSFASQELVQIKSKGELALRFLGYHDDTGVLRSSGGSIPSHTLDAEISAQCALEVLVQLARLMLSPGAAGMLGVDHSLNSGSGRGNPVTGDLADDAYQLATDAVRLRPQALGAKLTQAQALLAVLLSTAARSAVHSDATEAAIRVERLGLEVRDVYRDWNGVCPEAVSAAARGRELQGDALGALRLTQAAPDGLATTGEASHPDTIRVTAHLAAVTGQTDLALRLASAVRDVAESQLLRASILLRKTGMGSEAEEALATALKNAGERKHVRWQALLGLARRGAALAPSNYALLTQHLEQLDKSDTALADLVRARIALIQGDAQRALELARRHPESELSLEVRADALGALGRADEAVDQILEEASRRGDHLLYLEAMRRAGQYQLFDRAHDVALRVMSWQPSPGVEAEALRTVQYVERVRGNWQEVVRWTKQIIANADETGKPIDEAQVWTLAEAHYFTGHYADATSVLVSTPGLSLNDRDRVRLLLSTFQLLFHERRETDAARAVNDLGGPAFELFLRAASEWSHDEQIASFALNIALTAPHASLTEEQLVEIRGFSDQYFEVHGEEASIKQISVEHDNFDDLLAYLESTAPRTDALQVLSEQVTTGHLPLAALTQIVGRSYAEALIRMDFGCIIAFGGDDNLGQRAAQAGIAVGRVVIDTSVLVVGPLSGVPLRNLVSKFDAVLLHHLNRRDIERARANLALRSTGTLGWDSRAERPLITQTTDNDAARWSRVADELWNDITLFSVAQRRPEPQQGLLAGGGAAEDEFWMAPLMLAQRAGLALWADDLSMRVTARSLGVEAFSTLDLINTAFQDQAAVAESQLRSNRVVDIPIAGAWLQEARDSGWDSNSPFALAIARRFAWRDAAEAFNQYRTMIRLRPADISASEIAKWTHLSCVGLALTLVPNARLSMVTQILAWTILNADTLFANNAFAEQTNDDLPKCAGEVTQCILTVAAELRERFYPSADELTALVRAMGDILRRGMEPNQVGRLVASLAGTLPTESRKRVMSAFLTEPA